MRHDLWPVIRPLIELTAVGRAPRAVAAVGMAVVPIRAAGCVALPAAVPQKENQVNVTGRDAKLLAYDPLRLPDAQLLHDLSRGVHRLVDHDQHRRRAEVRVRRRYS